MRLPVQIAIKDTEHCSLYCPLMQVGNCIARGTTYPWSEMLKRDSDGFQRTLYCKKKASENFTVNERCPKCGGRCRGETFSSRTVCLDCGAEFERVEDQDEHYLRNTPGYTDPCTKERLGSSEGDYAKLY